MQPFLLEFVDSKAFEILIIGLAIAAVLGAIGVIAGVVALGLRLRNNWRWWNGLDEKARPEITRRYFLSKAKTLALLALTFGALELLTHLKQRSYERSPANVLLQQLKQQDMLRGQVTGMYTLPDTVLPVGTRAAQQGQDGWSLTDAALPAATLVQLTIRRDGTFAYRSKLLADNTPSSEGSWQWLSLTGHPEDAVTYGPVFFVHHTALQNLWAVKESGGFIFFGAYKKNERDIPFGLKRQVNESITAP